MREKIISFKELKTGYKKLYIYGAGRYAKELLEYCKEELEYIDAILVTHKDSSDILISENIVELKDLNNNFENAFVIFAMKEDSAKSIMSNNELNTYIKNYITISEDLFLKITEENSNSETILYYEMMGIENKLFQYVEIETVNRCNGECQFCPVNARAELQRPYAKMSGEMFESIINQLKELNYSGELALFSNNEPFIDERIFVFAEYARNQLPNAFIYLFTNAKLLSPEGYLNIIKYLDFMQIDMYIEDGIEEPDNIKKIRIVSKEFNYDRKTMFYRISPNAVRYSRAGNSPNSKTNTVCKELCRLPLLQMVIRPDGKVSMCCNDALGQITIGDISKESLVDAWNNELRKTIINKVMSGREFFELCKFCNSIDRRPFEGRSSNEYR